jgi:glycosyltransferase involved in cell wall biosynthesis
MRGYLIKHNNLTPSRVDVIGGGVNLDLFTNTNDRTVAQREWDLCGKFVVSYIGTLGAAHDLSTVLAAAAELRGPAPDVAFVLAGEGAAKLSLEREAKRNHLTNIRFIDRQDIAKIPSLIAASDVCLAVLRNDPLFETVVPTKIFEYMACGKPVLSNIQGETRNLLNLSGAGMSVSSGDPGELVRGILGLRGNKNRSARLGEAGRSYVLANRSWEKLARDYMIILKTIMKRASLGNRS